VYMEDNSFSGGKEEYCLPAGPSNEVHMRCSKGNFKDNSAPSAGGACGWRNGYKYCIQQDEFAAVHTTVSVVPAGRQQRMVLRSSGNQNN
jgi:hypothetical protein